MAEPVKGHDEPDSTETTISISGTFANVGNDAEIPLVNCTGENLQIVYTSTEVTATVIASATAPGAPTIGTATAGNTSATVNWTAGSNGGSPITGYTVTAYDSTTLATTTDACPSSDSSTSTTCTVTGLANGNNYTFKVAAINAINTGSFSGSSNSIIPGTDPGALLIETATPGVASATVNWTDPTSNGGSVITDYTVSATDLTTSANGDQACTATGATATSCTVTGLTSGDSYTFTVTATNGVGTSPASSSSNPVTPTGAGTTLTITQTSTSLNPTYFGGSTSPHLSIPIQGQLLPVAAITSGTVTFYAGATVLGSAAVNAYGIAEIVLSPPGSFLAVGSYSITASYGGTSTYAASTSSPFDEIVQANPTSLTLSTNAASAIAGAPGTFTATVGTLPERLPNQLAQ